ncbi:MAG: RecB family exonuclease [Gemmatimonadota bacterium]
MTSYSLSLTLETSPRELPVLSPTAIGMYLRCPQQWKLRYVDRRPQPPRPYLNLGTAVHAALQAFYEGRLTAPASLEEMEAAFEASFDPAAYPTDEERARRHADGLRMVRDFHALHAPEFRPALQVELGLRFECGGVRCRGIADRIDKLDPEGVRIVDYKTGGKLTLDRARESDQLTLYQMGVEQALGLAVRSVGLYHVPSQTLFEVPGRDEARIREVEARVRAVARGIEREEFEPAPGAHCDWCDFRPWCPAYADEYPENWTQEPLPPAPTHQEAARLADRYGRLKREVKERDDELAEIRARLERFFDATGERTVAGETFQVRAKRTVDYRFDPDELRAVLEPAGLWERVLRPDWRAGQRLLEDPEIPEEVRERLRELARERAGWTLRARPRD